MASGGIVGDAGEQPGAVELLTEELESAVAEAHKLNRTVAAHAHSCAAISNAVHAGVDSVEHGSMLDAETANLMRERGTVLVPTVSAIEALVDNGARLGVPVDEVCALVALGMDRDRALRACTSVAAQLLGRGDSIGSVAVGHAADMAVVNGDLSADVRALRDVRYAIRRSAGPYWTSRTQSRQSSSW